MSKPNPIDTVVGARLRLHRQMAGMSQSQLADAVGITFQQVQKYERAANRISASRLVQFANALNMPVSAFFEDLPGPNGAPLGKDCVMSFLGSPDGVELAAAWMEIERPEFKRQFLQLIRTVAQKGS